MFNAETGAGCGKSATMGGPGDSFYEYIVKFYELTGKNDQVTVPSYLMNNV